MGGGEGFFFPLPLPLPQFFFLSPTLGKFFTSPQLSTISRWRPEQPMEICIHSPHQNPPALQAKKTPSTNSFRDFPSYSPAVLSAGSSARMFERIAWRLKVNSRSDSLSKRACSALAADASRKHTFFELFLA